MSFSDELRSFPADPKSQRLIKRWLDFGFDVEWAKLLKAEARTMALRNQHLDGVLANGINGARQLSVLLQYPPRLSAKQFIQLVLSARYGVGRLNAREAEVKTQFEDLKAEFAEYVGQAESPREIDDAIAEFKPKFEALDRAIYDFRAKPAGGRKDQNGSRTRKSFVQRMQAYLLRRCGSPMDDVVAALLDIVFSGKDHSKDDARIARRATTRTPHR